jgi:hypothetical protein
MSENVDLAGLTNGQLDPVHYGPAGDTARRIASYCEGDARANVYKAALAEIERLAAREAELVAALELEHDDLKRTRQLLWQARVETEARNVYDGWWQLPGWSPWTPGGNSHKQEEARKLARAALGDPA